MLERWNQAHTERRGATIWHGSWALSLIHPRWQDPDSSVRVFANRFARQPSRLNELKLRLTDGRGLRAELERFSVLQDRFDSGLNLGEHLLIHS